MHVECIYIGPSEAWKWLHPGAVQRLVELHALGQGLRPPAIELPPVLRRCHRKESPVQRHVDFRAPNKARRPRKRARQELERVKLRAPESRVEDLIEDLYRPVGQA